MPKNESVQAVDFCITTRENVPEGYAKFNNGNHLCVEVPDDAFTISAKTKDGRRITFAFCCYGEPHIPRCCDIQFHDSGKTLKNGSSEVAIQSVAVRGCGPLLHVSKLTDEKPCTLIVVDLNKGE